MVLAVGLGLLASPGGAGAAGTIPPLVTTLQDALDGVGDVVDTLTASLLDDGAADVTSASVEYAPGWIRMRVHLKNPINPLRDSRWSDANFVEWSFDTNGDADPDYTVEFSTEEGQLYGAIFDVRKPQDPALCEADSASFSPQHGYTLVIDPKCVGNPKTIGYAVEIVLDTNPNDEHAPVLTDRVPDRGLRTVVAPVPPGAAGSPAPANAVSPQMVPPTPAAAPPVAAPAPAASKPVGAPVSTAPKPSGTSVPTAPQTTAGAAPVRAAAPAPTALATTPVPPPPGAPQPAASSVGAPAAVVAVTDLPRTGTASRQSALFGLGITLLGAGMLVMTGQAPNARVRLTAAGRRQTPEPV